MNEKSSNLSELTSVLTKKGQRDSKILDFLDSWFVIEGIIKGIRRIRKEMLHVNGHIADATMTLITFTILSMGEAFSGIRDYWGRVSTELAGYAGGYPVRADSGDVPEYYRATAGVCLLGCRANIARIYQ
jgi:hypothetical protein